MSVEAHSNLTSNEHLTEHFATSAARAEALPLCCFIRILQQAALISPTKCPQCCVFSPNIPILLDFQYFPPVLDQGLYLISFRTLPNYWYPRLAPKLIYYICIGIVWCIGQTPAKIWPGTQCSLKLLENDRVCLHPCCQVLQVGLELGECHVDLTSCFTFSLTRLA